MKKKLLESEPQLSPADIDYKQGQDEQLVTSVANKLNRTFEQITGWIESVSANLGKAS